MIYEIAEENIMAILKLDREYMVSSTELVRNFSKFMDKIKENPIYIMKNNDIEGIIMDIEEYEMLLKKIKYLENKLEDNYIKDKVVTRKQNFNIDDAIDEEEIMKNQED